MPELRKATATDLNFLVWIDIKDEGVSSSYMANWDDREWAAHRAQIAAYLDHPDKVAIICEADGQRIAAIYADFYRWDSDEARWPYLAEARKEFPPDARFCSVFQLWVDPQWRRRGLARQLKQALEAEALQRGVTAHVTKTEAVNRHVIELNHKLGYREIYRGPMWDSIERVALLKRQS